MKLYLAVLATLTAGERIAQAAHVVTELALAHPEAFRAWHSASNTVVVVTMDARALAMLYVTASLNGEACAMLCEPDRAGEQTAVAVFPSTAATRRLLRRAPLAGGALPAGVEPA